MSLELRVSNIVTSLGNSIAFRDITGNTTANSYDNGGNIDYSDVTAIRIKNATYDTLTNQAILDAGDNLVRYKEYIALEETEIDGLAPLSVGALYVPQIVYEYIVSGKLEETGYYVYPFLQYYNITPIQGL
jgi:hypothetical protein